MARWGLVPFFTKELSDVKGLSTINARAESITTAPTWREPVKKTTLHRACLGVSRVVEDLAAAQAALRL